MVLFLAVVCSTSSGKSTLGRNKFNQNRKTQLTKLIMINFIIGLRAFSV